MSELSLTTRSAEDLVGGESEGREGLRAQAIVASNYAVLGFSFSPTPSAPALAWRSKDPAQTTSIGSAAVKPLPGRAKSKDHPAGM